MVDDGEGFEAIAIELDWSAARDTPAQVASQFLVQMAMPAQGKPDGVFLIVGHANPPVIIGSESMKAEQRDSYNGRLPVDVLGRYYLSRARLEELRDVLSQLIKNYDEAVEEV